LDELIDEYGQPTVVKIDTEGFDHRVLRGLSRPVEHVLFEVNVGLPDTAAESFARLEELGRYEYYGAPLEGGRCSWLFRDVQRPEEILADLADAGMGDVYARLIS
jgi:hypothetical protein